MKILLMSDTHGYMGKEILDYVYQADEVWHAGDIGSQNVIDDIQAIKPLKAVYGNIDDMKIRQQFPEILRFKIDEIDILMTHIGGYPGKYSPLMTTYFKQHSAPNLFICGHSHILKIMNDKQLNLLHVNPGAIGKYGFHHIRTMVRFEIDKKEIKNMEIIEFKK